jgi:hypothetical protein
MSTPQTEPPAKPELPDPEADLDEVRDKDKEIERAGGTALGEPREPA